MKFNVGDIVDITGNSNVYQILAVDYWNRSYQIDNLCVEVWAYEDAMPMAKLMPPEPTAIGAVHMDRYGERFVKYSDHIDQNWISSHDGGLYTWREISG
jgi:hypothetical protein